MVAKIADFGTSVLIDNETCLLTPFPGTTDYMPPEAADGDYSEKLDVFSFGHLSIYVLNQQQPCPLLRCTYVKQGEVRALRDREAQAISRQSHQIFR
jgi:serine/threonine protein kinase